MRTADRIARCFHDQQPAKRLRHPARRMGVNVRGDRFAVHDISDNPFRSAMTDIGDGIRARLPPNRKSPKLLRGSCLVRGLASLATPRKIRTLKDVLISAGAKQIRRPQAAHLQDESIAQKPTVCRRQCHESRGKMAEERDCAQLSKCPVHIGAMVRSAISPTRCGRRWTR